MDRLVIDTEILKDVAGQFSGADTALADVYGKALQALASVRSAAPGQDNIIRSVSSLSSRINSAADRAGTLSGSCRTAAEMWEECEISAASYPSSAISLNTVNAPLYAGADATDTAYDANAFISTNSVSTIVDLAEGTCEINKSVFDPDAIEHVYYLLMNRKAGHSAIMLVDKNGNAMHYCFYDSSAVGIRFMPSMEVASFMGNGEISWQISSIHQDKCIRYPDTYDLMLDCKEITDSKEVYNRCLENWLTSKKSGITYNLFTNNCDDLAYDVLFDEKSPSPIPKITYEQLKKAVVDATGEDNTFYIWGKNKPKSWREKQAQREQELILSQIHFI